MPETQFKSQPKMPKSAPKSLKAPTFIQSIRSTFSLRRSFGCSSTTAIRMSASCRPIIQPITTSSNNNNVNRNCKKNSNFMIPRQRKVVVAVAGRNSNNSRRHRQQQFLDLRTSTATPNSTPTTNKSCSNEEIAVAKEDPTQATLPTVTTVATDNVSMFRHSRSETQVFQTSQHRRVPLQSPDELVEILKRQTNILIGISNSIDQDQFRHWRLDTDNMNYEQLLELGDKIGYVSTGLKESKIPHFIKRKTFSNKTTPFRSSDESEPKCSICQEEYEQKDKLGLLKCGHSYHRDCVKQWLRHKKTCPVCKSEVMAWC